jgi:lipopolysaccharide transport system ATP-binding protein
MSDIAIRVENLAKQYRIGRAQERYDTLRDAIGATLRSRKPRIANTKSDDTIWALKDVSFEVQRGEVLGIIGRNGAGKSTLLKILSRITEPTSGRAEIHGRVGSLLEVGTGFHPELTGRENIYLNGAILGMRRREIELKFDEIVAFAEVERFLDTPVKHYSSGMYVRLAFAVAAHLEPEILLVDEVLAVGDAQFQKRCLGAMEDVAHAGRTVLFVSHNMAAVQQLCTRAILIKEGCLQLAGPPNEVTRCYLQGGAQAGLSWERTSPPTQDVFIRHIELATHDGQPISQVTTGTNLAIIVDFTILRPIHDLQLTVGLLGPSAEDIFDSSPQDARLDVPGLPGEYRAKVDLPAEMLLPKTYGVKAGFWLLHGGVLDANADLRFTVQETSSLATVRPGGRAGVLVLPCRWSIEQSAKSRAD